MHFGPNYYIYTAVETCVPEKYSTHCLLGFDGTNKKSIYKKKVCTLKSFQIFSFLPGKRLKVDLFDKNR
jgi:hypothetical protein